MTFAPGGTHRLDRVYAGEADPAEIRATQEQFDNYYVESAVWQER